MNPTRELKNSSNSISGTELPLMLAWRWFWLPLVLLMFFSVTIIYFWSDNEYSTLMSHVREDEKRYLDVYIGEISDSIDHVFFDLQWLPQQNDLLAWLETESPESLDGLTREYANLIAVRPFYDHLRLLDESGMEVFRVGHDDGVPVIVPRNKLQNKSNRYYFKDTYRLPKGTVYVSPMDLNVEHGNIEIPYKPMIRFVTPVYDIHNRWRGSLVFNYLGSGLIDVLKNMSRKVSGSLMLLNREGYWLAAENPQHEWGFMFKDRQDRLFSNDYPEAWTNLKQADSGQFLNEDGLFTYARLDLRSQCLMSYQKIRVREVTPPAFITPDIDWTIISHIPPQKLADRFIDLQRSKWMFLALGLFGSLLIASLFYRDRTKHKIHQDELEQMAFYDNLTGLTSRALFVDQIRALLHHSRREDDRFALMVLDLDGFKQINDSYGHEGGDKLLCLVAERLTQSVRATDIVARTGGDEFSVILSRIEHLDVVSQVAGKILESLQKPFQINNQMCHIGASIGFSVSSREQDDAAELWRQADVAMYRAKQMGKNRIFSYNEM